jgi:hypothetical protein
LLQTHEAINRNPTCAPLRLGIPRITQGGLVWQNMIW